MKGWVKLHRSIMQSPTFKRLNAIQQLITIYIILNANHKDGVWYDIYKDVEVPIKRGQLITSRNKIVNEWFKGEKDITESKVRTTLSRLERYGFLTIESTNSYSLITICNYNVYQSSETEVDQQDNQVLTKQSPSDDQALATNKNVKNVKNVKKKDLVPKTKTFFEQEQYKLAELLYSEMLKNNSNVKKPNLDKWSNDIRLMIERDNRTIEQIRYLIIWSQQDSFWSTNILSTTKLRKQFDQLVLKVKQQNENKKTNTTGKQQLTESDWERM